MPAGFVTSRPGARFGDTWNAFGTWNHDYEWGFKFVCPGTGTKNITEIGCYVEQPDATPPAIQMAIFTHDSANNCPDVIVANSQSGTIGGASAAWYYAALTSCQVTGGETYWICFIEGQEDEISCLSGSGGGLYKSGLTPYTFSTGDDWHTHTDITTYTPDVYAIYSDAGGAEPSVFDNAALSESVSVEQNGFSFGHNTAFTGATDDLTQAFTCEATAKILILAIVNAGSTNREAVAPTYNGVNLTQADIVRKYVTSPETNVELWHMIDPPVSASYNIVVPNSGTITMWCKATSFKVSGIGDAILDLATGNTGSSANPSVDIVTTTAGALIYGVLGDGRNAAPSVPTGYNINITLHSTYSDSNQYYIQTSAGSWACGWTCLTDDWGMCVVAFKLSFGISVADCLDNKAIFGRN
jgi:hypothetical protein